MEATLKLPERDGFFAFELQFFHPIACDYIYNTLLPRMLSLIPKFDANLATIRLLLAEFKCARPSASDFPPSRPEMIWQPSTLLYHFGATFDWMSSIHKDGYNVPSSYLEEFGTVIDTYSSSAQARKVKGLIRQGVAWGSKAVAIHSLYSVWSGSSMSYICWILRCGLEQCLLPEALERLKSETSRSEVNMLLTAAVSSRVDFVRRLLRDGRTPQETVGIFLSDLRGLQVHDFPNQRVGTSIWMVFLWKFAEGQLNNQGNEVPSLILEEFLNHRVDSVIRSSTAQPDSTYASSHSDCAEVYVLSLSELVNLRQLPNKITLQKKLKNKERLWRQFATKMTAWPRMETRHPWSDLPYKALTLELVDSRPDLYLDSIITKSDQLSAPFSFILL